MIVKVTGNNKTYLTQVIDPHHSLFFVIPFTDVETDYKITISTQGHVIHTMAKERPSYLLPRPIDNSGWHIKPPDKSGTPIYSQDYLNNIIASLTLEVLLKATVAAVVGMLIGAFAKKTTLFLAPTDVITILFCAGVVIDLIFNFSGFSIGFYYLPMVGGYFLGFVIAHVSYVMVQQENLADKSSTRRATVLYSPSEEIGVCIQQQSNKALIKRWLGIHHRLGTDGGLAPDWADSTKYPYFPKFRRMIIMIEDSVTEYEEVPIFFGMFKTRSYTTYWRLSNASKFPKGLWKKSSAAIIWARDLIDRLYSDLVGERQKAKMLATQVGAEMHTYTINRSAHRAVYEKFEKPVAPLTIPETMENVMRPTTRALASPHAMPEDVEPEETEGPHGRDNEFEEEAEPEMNNKQKGNKERNERSRRN